MKDVYDIVAEARRRPGQPLALATMVRVEGSSYRRPGARLLILSDGCSVGSLSGGCIEDEIVRQAGEVLTSGDPLMIEFDTRRRFGCHGKIHILIERIEENFLAEIDRKLTARQSCTVITTLEGSRLSVSATPDGSLPQLSYHETAGFPGNPLVQVIHPPLRLLIVGEGPDTAPLRELANVLGWMTVEGAEIGAIEVDGDNWTAAIVKSHNFGRDFAALRALLPMNLRYVGLIGPKKRRDELLHELLQIGVSINAGFFAPAGLDINSETPAEIALALVGEIQRVFAGGTGASLRERKVPIHAPTRTGSPDAVDSAHPAAILPD